LLALIGIVLLLTIFKVDTFDSLGEVIDQSTGIYIIYSLLFIGFGIKVPLWPFHYWITKTHVESPTGFSIYLSGFLVKTALYALYRILANIYLDAALVIPFSIIILGFVDSSLKM